VHKSQKAKRIVRVIDLTRKEKKVPRARRNIKNRKTLNGKAKVEKTREENDSILGIRARGKEEYIPESKRGKTKKGGGRSFLPSPWDTRTRGKKPLG